jgi:pimeloyl-ACP methyl ester carboxylesterase
MPPQTRYAKAGDVYIAYQVTGDGGLDLLYVPGFVSHVEHSWEEPGLAQFFQRLGAFSRLIRLDKRGTGLSDRISEIPTLEQRTDDLKAVMDAAGSTRAALLGISEGGPVAMLFAATYPERTRALVLYDSYACWKWAPDYPFGQTEADFKTLRATLEADWGGPVGIAALAPSASRDARFQQWWAKNLRLVASPGAALAVLQMTWDTDVRHVLPAVRVPTLVLHRTGDQMVRIEHARYLAQHLPNARLVELPGTDHIVWVGDAGAVLAEVEDFLTGVRPAPEPDRVLATILFADIAASTEKVATLGDRRWHEVLDAYYSLARDELTRYRGRELDTAGDGFFAAFDGPARAIRCALAIVAGARTLGLEVRAGVHTGECEVIGTKLGGIAVHVGARVAALASAGEVLVSQTVKDLVAGSGLRLEDRGLRTLKGIPGEWRLFAAVPAS